MSSNIVDYSELETVKENVQPLKQGRNPHHLQDKLTLLHTHGSQHTGHTHNTTDRHTQAYYLILLVVSMLCMLCVVLGTDQQLKQCRKEYEQSIRQYVGEQPLTPWMRYIRWTQQHYLDTNGIKSYYLPLLEKCTRTFLHDMSVNSTLAYLKVWLLYIDHIPESEELFQFLATHNIGIQHALYWHAYSMTLEEKYRNPQRAESVLQEGINRAAQPMDKLKTELNRCEDISRQHTDAANIQICNGAEYVMCCTCVIVGT